MSKIDLIIDALLVAESVVWSAKIAEALVAARELKEELAKPSIPTKIVGPNLEEILNAAGFYRGDAVCCKDYEKCIKPCTPRGRWQEEQDATAQFRKNAFAWDGDAWGEMAAQMSRDFVERAKKNWESPPKDVDTITMTELRNTDLYRKVQIQLLRDILRDDNT